MKQKEIAIVHYNTPELTEALIKSIRKWMGKEWHITIMDNSDQRPFTKKIKGVRTLINRHGQLVDFDKELAKYPNKCEDLAYKGNFASVKHMMSVQYLMDEVLPEGFILMDSDILLKKDVSYIVDENFAAAGRVIFFKGRRLEADRLLPYCCYLNVPMLKEAGIKFYNPDKCWGLQPGGKWNPKNLYDTGASLLEEIKNSDPKVWCRNHKQLEDEFVHFGHASYSRNTLEPQKEWLGKYIDLWQ